MGFQDWLNKGTEQEKKNKRMFLAGGVLGLFLLFWLMSGRNDRKEPERPAETTGGEFFTLEERKVWITRFEKDLQDISKKITELSQVLQKTKQEIEAEQQKWQAKMEERIKALEEQPVRMLPEEGRPGPTGGVPGEWPPEIGITQAVPIQVYSALPEEKRPPEQPPAEPHKAPTPVAAKGALPAGSFAQAALLTGVDAPTGGQPYPVVFLVKEHFTGPNSTQIPLKGCLVIGKAEGSLSSERAIIQLTRLSCTLGWDTPVEQEISGYAVDKDGKLGLKGKVVSKAGRKIAASLLANFTAGLGAAIRQSEVETGRSSYVVIQSGIEIKGLEVASGEKDHFSDSD